MSLITLVAAVARDGAIGRDNALLWHIPEDMARFKAVTAGKPVVMGRKTWDSLPAKFRPLPGRRNLVVSRSATELPGAEVFSTLDAALAACSEPEVCVIGGSEIYALALPLASKLALTEVDAAFPDADRHFPDWPRTQFTEAAREPHTNANGLRFEFVDYLRRG
ncbi:dihydrofolate reductase [Roseateles sp. LYH14W]|uniref:Dihydrofolate reductase n=1 Tax=Pelomonas parva TaxID=3299032 RepID=A0ABW7FAL3_9BURK